jgi:hypothetical protein
MNQILSWAFDKLKVANPTIALILGGFLIALFYILSYLVDNGVVLAPWLLSIVPYLKALIVALGLGLNPSTVAYRFGEKSAPFNKYSVILILFCFSFLFVNRPENSVYFLSQKTEIKLLG